MYIVLVISCLSNIHLSNSMDPSSIFLQMNMQQHMQTILHQSVSTGYPLLDTLIVLLTVPFIIQMIQNGKYTNFIEHFKTWWYISSVNKIYTIVYHGDSDRDNIRRNVMGSVYRHNENSFTFRAIIVYLNYLGAFKECKEVSSFTCFGNEDIDMLESISNNYTLSIPTQPIEWKGITFMFSSHNEDRKSDDHGGKMKTVVCSTATLNGNDKEQMKSFVNDAIMYYKNIVFPPDNNSKQKHLCKYYKVVDSEKRFGFEIDRCPWPNRSFKSIFFPEKERLLQSLDDFDNRRGVFDESFEHPYRMGLIFHGPPGTGKTSLIKAIIKHTKRHPVFIPLGKLKKASDLIDLFTSANITMVDKGEDYVYQRLFPFSKRLYIFEDVDTECDLLKSRAQKAIEEKKELLKKEKEEEWYTDYKKYIENSDITLSTILNGLDGVLEPNGLMYILTTNKVEDFDEAVLRPGRIFMNLKMDYMTNENIVELLNYRFRTDEVSIMDIPDHDPITPATIENMCQHSDSLQDVLSALAKT